MSRLSVLRAFSLQECAERFTLSTQHSVLSTFSLVAPPLSVALVLLMIVGCEAAGAAQAPAGLGSASTVELKCKIVGSPGDSPRSLWLVELRNAAGKPLRQASAILGGTVRFKNLLPGIYRICLSGKGGRRSSESVDLTPAAGQKSSGFAKVLRVPASAAPMPNQYQVNVTSLAVPEEALQEMQSSKEAQLGGDEDGMVFHLKRAIEIYPDYADAWNNLGAHYHMIGDYDQSIRSFTKVTELTPDFYVGWMNLGSSLLATSRFQEAAEANAKALSLDPNDPIANSQLGRSYYYLHDYGEAKEFFKRALDLDPASADLPHLFLAHIAMGENSPKEAAEYLRGFLAYHPNAPNAPQVRQLLRELSEGMLSAQDPIRKYSDE
jgi:cytochrome c-type biogenesis protein CcmH/NrfG